MDIEKVPVVILAGWRGTRLVEETHGIVPKPMVPVGGIPMIEQVAGIYYDQGYRNFIVAAGHLWREFLKWRTADSLPEAEVQIANTGEDTQTGGRLLRIRDMGLLPQQGPFMFTYGDGMADVNLRALVDHHERMTNKYDALLTLTASRPPSRFGSISIQGGMVASFEEKPNIDKGWINAGFYISEKRMLDLIPAPGTRLEYDVLPVLALQNRLSVHLHPGYFQCVDTFRDLEAANEAARQSPPPWRRFRREEDAG
jgi:glucose-1-phosphate cytidylyltransferase